MAYIKRDMENLILSLASEYPCILVTGPRQVGKTTMLEHIMPSGMRKITLDDLQQRALAKSDPEMFLSLNPAPILIDEVQYAPQLFSYIKIAIDNGAAPGSYLLTGSQSFRLMDIAQESLAGRIALLNLSSLSQHELYGTNEESPFEVGIPQITSRTSNMQKADINEIFQRIWKGSMPGYTSGKYTNRDIFYSSYLQTYISRDIKEEVKVSDDGKFLDFIRAAACRAGQELNIHALATDVEISDDTAKRWLKMLEKSDITFFVRSYPGAKLKRAIKRDKLYFIDTGLVAYLTRYSSAEILQNGSINGAILENYVVSEIRKTYLNTGKECLLYYFRDKQNNEIDLIIESNGLLHPLEIKKTYNPSAGMTKAFEILKKSTIPTGMGGIICTKEDVSAINKETLIIPIWCI